MNIDIVWLRHGTGFVSLFPTPKGVYVRDLVGDLTIVKFYPIGRQFPGGQAAVSATVCSFDESVYSDRETAEEIELAVYAHMKALLAADAPAQEAAEAMGLLSQGC